MKFRLSLPLAMIFVISFVVRPGLVSAQDLSATQSASTVEVVTTQTHQTQLIQLQDLYRQELSKYRDNERLFSIAQQQFFQLQTLASLEQAVQASKAVMLARVDVLQTYTQFLELHLIDTTGIELGLKNTAVTNLITVLDNLKQHRTQLMAADDRTKIAKAVTDFKPLGVSVTQQTTTATMLVMYGRLQAVYDKTISVRDEIATHLEDNETNTLVLAEKKRGIEEINRTLEQVKTDLDMVKFLLNQKEGTSYGTSQVTTKLGTIYGGLSRSLSYFQELVR